MTKDYDPDSAEAMACKSQPVGVHTLASSPTNPRKTFDPTQMAELVQSVKEHGILTPILVRCWPANQTYSGDFPMYEVVAGERRFRAAKAAGFYLMPALVRDLTDTQVLEIQVIENLQRADLHPLEEADGYRHPTESSLTWKGVGCPPNWVREWLADDEHTMDMLKAVA